MPHPQFSVFGDDQTVAYKVTLPRDLYDQLEQLRQDQGRRSVSNVIVHGMSEWLEGRGRGEQQDR